MSKTHAVKARSRRTRTEYRWIDTSTLAGLRAAERLHLAGWTMGSVGLFRVMFFRRKEA